MRRLLPIAILSLAACSTTPRPAATPASAVSNAQPQAVRTSLTGMTQAELQQRLGTPSFVLREGPGLKLQWQNGACVLDAYLYPPAGGGGAAMVAHVDARRPGTGESVEVDGCASGLALR